MTKDDLLKILEDEIIGDGQGFPDQNERIAAVERIWPEFERLQKELKQVQATKFQFHR